MDDLLKLLAAGAPAGEIVFDRLILVCLDLQAPHMTPVSK